MRSRFVRNAAGTFFALAGAILAQNPHFQVYLAFGQSNMEGQGVIGNQDKAEHKRFKNMSALTCGSRTQGKWVAATAPIVRCNTKLSPLDWFGRTLADSLPETDTVGVVAVAVAGAKIEGFDQSTYQSYYSSQASWMTSIVSQYGGNPYARLVAVAKEAQKTGVIRGILLHQGESNAGDAQWASKVKKIYQSLLKDLGLDSSKVPLLAGEVPPTGGASGANSLIDALPKTISTAYVVSAKSLTIDNSDGQNLHFDAASYRTLGTRYAQTMYSYIKTHTVSVAPRTSTIMPEPEYLIYDVDGSLVARLLPGEGSTPGAEWNRIRGSLPNGIYFARGRMGGQTLKLANGR